MDEGFTGKMGDGYSYQMCKSLLLADGTKLSIQAGRSHYCDPRTDSTNGTYANYSEFEIGFPSRVIELLLPYAEDVDNPTDTVYAYVPKELIETIIKEAGGVVGYHSWEKGTELVVVESTSN
jgi:hypothetical protein